MDQKHLDPQPGEKRGGRSAWTLLGFWDSKHTERYRARCSVFFREFAIFSLSGHTLSINVELNRFTETGTDLTCWRGAMAACTRPGVIKFSDPSMARRLLELHYN